MSPLRFLLPLALAACLLTVGAQAVSDIAIGGSTTIDATNKPSLYATLPAQSYAWSFNQEKLTLPPTDQQIAASDLSDEQKMGMQMMAQAQRAALAEKGLTFSPDGSLLKTERSGDYALIPLDGTAGESVRLSRSFRHGTASSPLLIGSRSNRLVHRKDADIKALEEKVAQSVAAAQAPPEQVTLGQIYQAVEAAAQAGGVATLVDAGTLQAAQAAVLTRLLREKSLPDRIFSDRRAQNTVTIRLALAPSCWKESLSLGVSLLSPEQSAPFTKAFSNRLLACRLEQEGSYGQLAECMVKADALREAGGLYFYRFQEEDNRCDPAPVSHVFFDSNGFLHFSIGSGGVLLISDGVLTAS